MTLFYVVDDKVVVSEDSLLLVKNRITRSLKFAPGYYCGVQLEPITASVYSMILQWLREKNFDAMLIEDFDTVFFAREHDLLLFLLTWSSHSVNHHIA